MSHLGERVTSLVDGQLGVDATERALMHIAGCAECREAVEIERLTKQRLASLGVPEPSNPLVGRLLDMAGPSGPLPPRTGHVPGSPRPELVAGLARIAASTESARPADTTWTLDPVRGSSLTRPPARRGSIRPPQARSTGLTRMARVSRSSRNRVAAAMVGAVCLVGAGVAGGVANGGVADTRIVPPVDSFVLEHTAITGGLSFSDQTVMWGAVGAGR